MTTPHVHRDLIVAWADGAEIQVENRPRGWIDCAWPSWSADMAYRIKPVTVRYRVALMKDRDLVWTSNDHSEADARVREADPGFVRWLTDWQEVSV